MLSCAFSGTSARAADVVWHLAADGQSEIKIAGAILDFNRRELIIKTASGRESTVPSDRVKRIEFTRSPEHQSADQAFDSGQVEKAKAQYAAALKTETRPWVRREIAAQIVRSWTAAGDENQSIEKAGALFIDLAREDAAPPCFAAMPLAWWESKLSASLEAQARKWRASDVVEAQLLGASWLLASDREASLEILKSLSAHRDTRIADLATSQLWRAQIAAADRQQIERWQRDLEKFSPAMRAGPWFVVGLGWSRQKEPGRAALAFLRVPVQFPAERLLGSESLLAAAGQLVARGEMSEAQSLWQEIAARYPETPAARIAAERRRGP